MATDVTDVGRAPATRAPKAPKQRRIRPYRGRFVVVYAALVLVVGAAVAGIVLALGGGGGGTARAHASPRWSAWEPTVSGAEARAKEIAEHVGRAYRLPNGDQLLDVLAKRPSFSGATQTIPVHYVAIHGVKGKADQITAITPDNSEMFSLCGLGNNCAIATGQPTVARGRLVRREALELSLYTFKYVSGVDHVITLIPPRQGQTPTYAVYFDKTDLQQQLSEPLQRTLRGGPPAQPDAIPPAQAAEIDRLTVPHMYRFSIQPSQQGDLILVLAP